MTNTSDNLLKVFHKYVNKLLASDNKKITFMNLFKNFINYKSATEFSGRLIVSKLVVVEKFTKRKFFDSLNSDSK